MYDSTRFYIGGAWVEPASAIRLDVINPATERPAGVIALADATDVDRAVGAAQAAFPAWARSSRQDRIALFEAIIAAYRLRRADLALAITEEMGAPAALAQDLHAMIGALHLKTALNILKTYPFEKQQGGIVVRHEAVGVCALITPWNWPINQIAAKVAPALACGCTMVLKPSELSPFSAQIWTEIMDSAGVPAGVFNMIQGDGPTAGAALSSHPGVDMVSFTGSTRAGIEVARNAAPTIKRVHQELGGKSPNILLPDADIAIAVAAGVRAVTSNSGQSCNAPTRMLVPVEKMEEACAVARATIAALTVGDPTQSPDVGPVVSRNQFEKIQYLIETGISEGATLVAGGPGLPEGTTVGFYVRPTVFSCAHNDMAVAREEIFGPVLIMLPYHSIDDAIRTANDTPYGLAGYIQGEDASLIAEVASRLRVGQVIINQAHPNPMAPFGGYKQSGNGREWGEYGFEAFLETKALLGFPAPNDLATAAAA